MMLGTVPTSVPQFILLGNWLLEGNFKDKWLRLKSNKVFWVLSSLFIIHVIGLFYTTDLKAGWDDVRTKIPLMFLSLIFFSSSPLRKKEFHIVLLSFLAGTFLNLSWCFIYKHFIASGAQVREVSRFMSHIRLGFLVDMAIFTGIYFFLEQEFRKWKTLLAALILYFLFSLYALGLMSGMFNLCITGSLFLLVYYFKRNKFYASIILSVMIGFGALVYFMAGAFHKQHFQISDVPENAKQTMSASGNAFNHYPLTKQIENGIIVSNNIQELEVQNEWNRRAPNDSINVAKAQNLQRYYTLIRYISSKQQLKDSASVAALSANEIKLIQQGIPNYLYPTWPFFKKRFYELVCEYDEYKNEGNINGHSFTMRLFYLKSAISVIQKNKLFGVGTGDVQLAMNEAYRKSESPLDEEWYKRPHNQFITVTVALGFVGLLVFLFSLLYPILALSRYLSPLYFLFLSSAVISFLFEDTLETQSGLSFFAVFNTILLSVAYFKKTQSLPD
jgi:hypothetical protein